MIGVATAEFIEGRRPPSVNHQKGDAFICISGARFDTHTMAKELAKKAALLVVEKPVELDADCKTAVVKSEAKRS